MVDVSALATPIGLLIESIFGAGFLWAVGIVVLLLFVVFIVLRGGDLITFSAVLIPLIVVLAAAGLLPAWLIMPALVVLIIALFLGWRYLFPT
jgi:hypothetical protein